VHTGLRYFEQHSTTLSARVGHMVIKNMSCFCLAISCFQQAQVRTKKRLLKYAPNLAPQNATCFPAAHLATATRLGVCCPHLAAHESCYRRMCLCCHLLVKLTLTSGPGNFKTAKTVLFSQSCSNIQPRDNRS